MFWKKPVCSHDWRLIDTRIALKSSRLSIDLALMYIVGCMKCNTRKELDEYDYMHFLRKG